MVMMKDMVMVRSEEDAHVKDTDLVMTRKQMVTIITMMVMVKEEKNT